jgi:hypothetical protein
MLRSIVRLVGIAAVTAAVFLVADLALGYLVIQLLHLHRPYPDRSELFVLVIALQVTVPLVFGLALLGLMLARSAAQRLGTRRLLNIAALTGVTCSVAFTLEGLPREWGPWLTLLLPVLVVVVPLSLTQRAAARLRAGSAG